MGKQPLNTNHRHVRRRVVIRLFAVWLATSVAAGIAVVYFQLQQAQALVLRLAVSESRAFTASNLNHFNSPSAAGILRREAQRFLRQHFVFIKLYDRGKREILQVSVPGDAGMATMLRDHQHLFRPTSSVQHSAVFFRGRMLMHLLLPLRQPDGTLVGYFEGVYQVDRKTLAHIRDDVLGALALIVLVTLAAATALYPIIIGLNRALLKFSNDLLKANVDLMTVLGTAIAMRDADTGAHNYRVTIYATRLGEAIGLDPPQLRQLIAGAFLHDVGKIGIRDSILLKPGKHNQDELRIMHSHVALGVEVLRKSEWLGNARDVVEFHHERYDGSGYLRGLKGNEIPLNARIFAIADVFDALLSKRPYKEPWAFDDALRFLKEARGTHFDPDLLEAFERIAKDVHMQINNATEAALAPMLDGLVKKYFFE